MSFLILLFGMMANAKINIVYGIDGEKMKSASYALNEKSKVFSFDEMATMCEMDLIKGTLVVFCDHKENGSGAWISWRTITE